MKKYLSLLVLLSTLSFGKDIYQFSLPAIKGDAINFDKFKGKSILIVNIATRCGLTGQLDGLQKLHEKYKEKGLVVVGIPSNEFSGQTPEGNQEVAKFCRLKYGVNFPLAKKTKVLGDEKTPLYQYLLSATDGKEIPWNFAKFLISKDGKIVKRFAPSTQPLDEQLTKSIEAVL